MHSNDDGEPTEIVSDDEDENESRLSCSLRWLISKAYSHGPMPDYLPCEHFFQNEHDERFLSPDIALVLLSGDLYIRAFQSITHQQDQFFTYDDLISYFASQKISIDLNLLKQDDPLNAHVHLELIDHLMKLYAQMSVDQTLVYQRFEKLHLRSVLSLLNKSIALNLESLLIIWINGICEHMANQWSQRIPPVLDIRSALIDGTCLCALVSYYDEEFRRKKMKNDLPFLRDYLNHYREHKMTNIFPFTVKHLRENLISDINLQALLVDLFVLYEIDENAEKQTFLLDPEDEENLLLNKSNQTYSINGDDHDDDGDIEEFFISNHHQPQFDAGAILQTSTNHPRSMIAPIKSSLKSSMSASTTTNISPKKTSFKSTTTTWQRQAASNPTTPTSARPTDRTPIDDSQLTNEYLAVKMQLEMKKRSIERDKQRLENQRDNKRQTISQEAFKQLLQQKTRTISRLSQDFLSSSPSKETNHHQMPKSQTTDEFRLPRTKSSSPQPLLLETKRDESSIVDLSKPMTRDEFLNTLELLKKKYIETTGTTTTPNVNTVEDQRNDEGRRIEQLNTNIGELQQVLTSLSVKQEEIHNQAVNSSGTGISRTATFSTKSMTFPRRISASTVVEVQEPSDSEHDIAEKSSGLIFNLIDDPSASTALEMERKRELVLQRHQERQEAYERRRQMREIENNRQDDERRRKDHEEATKKLEREQRRDEIYRQYMMKKEKKPFSTNDTTNDEHPIIKMRPKSSATTLTPKPHVERRQTGPIMISNMGTPSNGVTTTGIFPDSDLNETISTSALSFVRMAEFRANKNSYPATKIDSRTLPRSSARSTAAAAAAAEPPLPSIPISEPRYPLAKPLSSKSNKQTIINALTQVILAGRVNDRVREQVCDEVERYTEKIKHFILLFRDSRLQFRGVYAYIPSTADSPPRLERLYGQGPKEITETMVEMFYKYNNGSKQFSKVPIKSFSVQCDAVAIPNHYWSQQSASAKRSTAQLTSLPPSD